MKNQVLSIPQMLHLKELGIDTSKASMVLIATDDDSCPLDWKTALDVISTHLYDVSLELFDADSSCCDHSYRKDCGVFTLQDIINLLPEYIPVNDEQSYDSEAELFINKRLCRYVYSDCEGYPLYTGSKEHGNNVLDSAYNLLCWCAENGYLNKQ